MTKLSVNLEYMFREAGDLIEDRIYAAADAGFTHVEIFSLENRSRSAIKQALDNTGATLHSMVVDPRIMLVLKDNHPKFLDTFRAAAQDAVMLNCKNLVCGSGTGAPFLPRHISQDIVAEAITQAADIAQEFNLTILLEAVNTRVDHPGAFFSRTEDTFYIADKLQRENVKILYDLYHSVAEGENIEQTMEMIKNHIGHIQLADFPGRGEPGTGKLDWKAIASLIDKSGYKGPVGIECYPTTDNTPDALKYIRSVSGC